MIRVTYGPDGVVTNAEIIRLPGEFDVVDPPQPGNNGLDNTLIDIKDFLNPDLFSADNNLGPYSHTVIERSRFAWVKLIKDLDTPKYIALSKFIIQYGGRRNVKSGELHFDPKRREVPDEVWLRWGKLISPMDLVSCEMSVGERAYMCVDFEIVDWGGVDEPWTMIRLTLPAAVKQYVTSNPGRIGFLFEDVVETASGFSATITRLKRAGDDNFIAVDEIPSAKLLHREASQ